MPSRRDVLAQARIDLAGTGLDADTIEKLATALAALGGRELDDRKTSRTPR